MHLLKFILLLASFMVGTQSAQEPRSVISKSGIFDKSFFDSLFYPEENGGVVHMQYENGVTRANERNNDFGIGVFESWTKGSQNLYLSTNHPQSSRFSSLYAFGTGQLEQPKSFVMMYQNNAVIILELNDDSFGTICNVFNELFNVDDFITSIQGVPDIQSGKLGIIFAGDTNCNRENFNGESPWYTKITENEKFCAIFNPADRMSTPVWLKNQESPSNIFPMKKEETFGKSFISRSGYYDRAFFDDILNVTIVNDDQNSFKAINFTESAKDNPNSHGLEEEKNSNPEDVVEKVWSFNHSNIPVDRGFEVKNENLHFTFLSCKFHSTNHKVIMGLTNSHGYLENTTLCSWINGPYFKKDELVDSLVVNLKHGSVIIFFQTTFPGCDNWHQPIVENDRFKQYFKAAEVWKFNSGVPVFSSTDDNLHEELASQVKEEQILSSKQEWTLKVHLGVTDSDEVEAEFIIV